MADLYTIGLAKIEIGDIDPDGGMGTDLEQLGYTNQDSCSFTQEDPETTDFFAEELDDPVVSISRAGKTTFNFSVMNPDVTVLQKLLGGTITGTGDAAIWNAPSTIPVIEQSVKITPKQGLVFSVPRMSILAKINGQFSKTNIFVIDVVGTVLIPTDVSVSKISATKA
ncbi:MAG: hypothetical protein LBJ63_07840 [Prevotellaceae bacterium]|jgi:hypothetical protein|nr:hypothetical protein [Prevotellaceae bacterium]